MTVASHEEEPDTDLTAPLSGADARTVIERQATAERQMAAVAGIAEAEELCLTSFRHPYARRRVNVIGGTGSGKTALLDALAFVYHYHGIGVTRDLAEADHRSTQVVLVDDAHTLEGAELSLFYETLSGDKSVVFASRSHRTSAPSTEALDDPATTVSTVILHRLDTSDIARRAEIRLKLEVPTQLSDVIADTTWGNLSLVDAALARLHDAHIDGISAATIRSWVGERVAEQLSRMSPAAIDLLAYTAIGAVLDVPVLTALLDISGHQVDELLLDAYASGLLSPTLSEPWGILLPLAQDLVIERLSDGQRAAIQDKLLSVELRSGHLRHHTVRRLADLNFLNRRFVDYVVWNRSPVSAATPSDPGSEKFAARSASDCLAEAASALRRGDLVSVFAGTDSIVERGADPDAPDVQEAVRLAAVAQSWGGNVARTAELHAYLGPDRIGVAAADAVIAAVGAGNHVAAESYGRNARLDAPTSSASGLELMARGTLESLTGDGSEGMRTMMRSVSILRTAGITRQLVDSPAALAALMAMARGEPDVAETALAHRRAARSDDDYEAVRSELLLAWSAMLRGDLAGSAQRVVAVENRKAVTGRDRVLVQGLRVGLARRQGDHVRMAEIWQRVRAELDMYTVDLFNLPSLAEFYVSACWCGDQDALRRHNDCAVHLIEGLGNPPLWSTPFYWHRFVGGALAEDAAEAAAWAHRLGEAGAVSGYARGLADAANVWLDVMDGRVDGPLRSAQRLQQAGLPWEAWLFASQAATRTDDASLRRELVTYAGELSSAHVEGFESAAGHGGMAPAPSPLLARLTAREREVAALVVRGASYREIGAELLISPKTVEHHVARIRRRIGVQSRGEMLEVLRPLSSFII